jgi:hypothetical protein
MNLSIPEHGPTKPDRESVVWGFLLAPFVAALLLACWAPFYEGEPMPQRIVQTAQIYCIYGAYPLAVIFGIPTYKFCRSLNMRPSWLNCAIGGAGIAGIPSFLMELLMTMSFSPGEIARENGHDLIVNGHATLWAWRDALISVSQISTVAFIGGLVFWIVTFTSARRTDEPRVEQQL